MSFWSRITSAFRGDSLNHQMDEEFAAHIEEGIAAGNDPTEVHRTFRLPTPPPRTKPRRPHRRLARLPPCDLVFGWRQLLKRKITTGAVVLSLASPSAPAPPSSASSTRSSCARSP